MATVSDKKIGVDADNNGIAEYYEAIVRSASDYYPFGWQMPGRKLNPQSYTYGFNGQLTDPEWMGGESVAFEFRTQDPRLGRFLTTDPLTALRPNQSPYVFAANNPIWNIDYLGLIDTNGTEPINMDIPESAFESSLTEGMEAVVKAKKTPSTTDAYADHQNKMGQENIDAGVHWELLSQDGGAGSAKNWNEYYAQKEAFIKAQCGSCSYEDALDIYYTESGVRAADKAIRDKEVLGKLGFFANGFADIGSVVGPGSGVVKPGGFRAGARPKMNLGAARGRANLKIDPNNPSSIWGKTGDEVIEEMTNLGFENVSSTYKGSSTAIKLVRSSKHGNATVIVNYGGGRNGGAASNIPVYYKFQGISPGYPKTKVIGPNYKGNWRADKTFRIIDGVTGKVLKKAGTILD